VWVKEVDLGRGHYYYRASIALEVNLNEEHAMIEKRQPRALKYQKKAGHVPLNSSLVGHWDRNLHRKATKEVRRVTCTTVGEQNR